MTIGKTIITIILALLATGFAPSEASAAGPADEMKAAYDAALKAEGTRPGDYRLIDQDGRAFTLGEYYSSGRTLVVSFVYTECPHVCSTITASVKKAADAAREKHGDSFDVLTIGFDSEHDTPENMREYGEAFTDDFKNLRFASVDVTASAALVRDFGFYYRRAEDGSFDHMDMATVVRPGGVIMRQVFGLRTYPEGLVSALGEAITGRPAASSGASVLDKLKYLCYRYDPYTGRYVVNWPVFAGAFIQLVVIAAVVWAVWGGRILARLGRARKSSRQGPER